MSVDIVDTDVDEYEDIDLGRFRDPIMGSFPSAVRIRARSSSFFASCSSAMPFLRNVSAVVPGTRLLNDSLPE